MSAFDEKQFLRTYKSKPELAFRQLMDEFKDRMFLFCRRVTKGTQDAEDLTQEVFIRVWKGLMNFRGESALNTWIYRIAWNVCASHLDKKGRAMEMTPYEEGDQGEESQVYMRIGTEDQEIVGFEQKQYLEVLFESLPSSHKQVLTLYYLQGQNYQEIAEVTGWKMGTVKATIHRAKSNLRAAALEERVTAG